MLTKKPTPKPAPKSDDIDKFIAAAPLSGKGTTKEKKAQQHFLHLPISLDLRNQLKAAAAIQGKNFYDHCIEILEKAAQTQQ